MRVPSRRSTLLRAVRTLALVALALALPLASPVAHARGQSRAARVDSADTYRGAIAAARAAEDSSALSAAHNALGLLFWSLVEYDSALVHLGSARDIREANGDSAGLGRSLNNIGSTYYQSGNYEPALEAFTQSLAVRRAIGDRRGSALVLANIGKTYQDWRQYDRALPALEEAAREAEEAGDAAVHGYVLHSLGRVYLDLGDYARARSMFERSMARYMRSEGTIPSADSASGWSINTLSLARVLVAEGRPRDALPLIEQVLAAADRGRAVRGRMYALLEFGRAHRALGDAPRAAQDLRSALQIAREASQRVVVLEVLEELAALEEARGNSRAALGHLRAYNALRDTVFSQASAQRIAAMESRLEAERQLRVNDALREAGRGQAVVIERQRTVVLLGAALLVLFGVLVAVLVRFNRQGKQRESVQARTNAQLASANTELRDALSEVRTLKGLIPICANCKKVRDDRGFWEAVETYVAHRSDATFSHGICATCGPELYGDDWHPAEPDPRSEP